MPAAAVAQLVRARQVSEPLSRAALEQVATRTWKRLFGKSLRAVAKPKPIEIAVSASVPLIGVAPAVVVLSVPDQVAAEATVRMLGLQADELASGDVNDALAELVDEIGANVSRLLPAAHKRGAPVVVHGAGLTSVVAGARVACETTLKCDAGLMHLSVWR